MTTTFTMRDLWRMLSSCSGIPDGVELDDGTAEDTAFDELGYDSLAVLELLAQVNREHGVTIPDGTVTETNTPRQALHTITRWIDLAGKNAPHAPAGDPDGCATVPPHPLHRRTP